MVFLVEGRRQTLLYCYKWRRGQHFVLRQIAKTAANNSIIARTRTLTRKEPWNKNGSKSTNHKLQTVTFWTLWNEHLLPKRYAKFRWYKWAAFEKSWLSGRRYFYFSRLTPLSLDYYTIPPATQAIQRFFDCLTFSSALPSIFIALMLTFFPNFSLVSCSLPSRLDTSFMSLAAKSYAVLGWPKNCLSFEIHSYFSNICSTWGRRRIFDRVVTHKKNRNSNK